MTHLGEPPFSTVLGGPPSVDRPWWTALGGPPSVDRPPGTALGGPPCLDAPGRYPLGVTPFVDRPWASSVQGRAVRSSELYASQGIGQGKAWRRAGHSRAHCKGIHSATRFKVQGISDCMVVGWGGLWAGQVCSKGRYLCIACSCTGNSSAEG